MKIYYYREVDSTMDLAHKFAEKGISEGSIILADIQRKGRGRKGNKWYSPEGGLWFSIILYPKLQDIKDLNFFPLLIGVSVLQGLQDFLSQPINLKWPNDLEIDGKKVGGIIIEGKWENNNLKYLIIGIGINLFIPLEFFNKMGINGTSLLQYLKEKNKFVILEIIYKKIMENYKEFPKNKGKILSFYTEKFPYIGKEVTIHSEFSQKLVKILNIDEDGSLIVDEGGLLKKYSWGVISVRP
jgi:BirA family biotin operon repressor/biotin-[acetyl-CoA-carboxylase] ligase